MSYLDLLDAYLLDDIMRMARILHIKDCSENHGNFFGGTGEIRLYCNAKHIYNQDSTYNKVHYDDESCICSSGILQVIDRESQKRALFIEDYITAMSMYPKNLIYFIYHQIRDGMIHKGSISSYASMYMNILCYQKIYFIGNIIF